MEKQLLFLLDYDLAISEDEVYDCASLVVFAFVCLCLRGTISPVILLPFPALACPQSS